MPIKVLLYNGRLSTAIRAVVDGGDRIRPSVPLAAYRITCIGLVQIKSSVIGGRKLAPQARNSQNIWLQATCSFHLRVKGNQMRNTNGKMLGAKSVDTRYIQIASRSASVLFQGKWKVEILCAMRSGTVRVGQLSRLIPGASKKMLAHNLKQLEADGIVLRRDMSEMVLHVEYDFTNEAREEVCSLLDHLAQWGRIYALSRTIPSTNEKPPII